jgi:hypothetical protein
MAKRHHSKRDPHNVAGASVIRRGCGGGDKVQAKPTLEQAAIRKRMLKESANLSTFSKEDKARIEREREILAGAKPKKTGKVRSLRKVRR